MATHDTTPTRRALLGAIAAVPAIAAVAMPTIASAALPDRAAWDRAIAEYDRLKAIAAPIYATHDVAWERAEALRPDIEMIDWKHLRSFGHKRAFAHSADLDKHWADFVAGEGVWWWSPTPEAMRAEMTAALDTVREYRRLHADANQRTNIEHLGDECDRMSDAIADAETAILRLPAPDAAALSWKLERLFGPEAVGKEDSCPCYSMDVISPLMSDTRRLAGVA